MASRSVVVRGTVLSVEFGANEIGIGAQQRHLEPFADIAAVPFNRQCRNPERRAVGIEILHQPTRPQHMRVLQEVFGAIDRRETDIQLIKPGGEIGVQDAP